jgi:hypothetical protein
MPAPNLLEKCRPKGEHSPLDRLTLPHKKKPQKQKTKLDNKQGTEKDMQQSRQGALCTLEKWGGARS